MKPWFSSLVLLALALVLAMSVVECSYSEFQEQRRAGREASRGFQYLDGSR